jgi:hypothetical protein
MTIYTLDEAKQIIDLYTELLLSPENKIRTSKLKGYSILDIHYSLALELANEIILFNDLSNEDLIEKTQDLINVDIHLLMLFPSRLISDAALEEIENLDDTTTDYKLLKYQINKKYEKSLQTIDLENLESMSSFRDFALSNKFDDDYWDKISIRLGIKLLYDIKEKEDFTRDDSDFSDYTKPFFVPLIILATFSAISFLLFNNYYLSMLFLILEVVFCIKLLFTSFKKKEGVNHLIVILLSAFGIFESHYTQIIAGFLMVFGGFELAYLKYKQS